MTAEIKFLHFLQIGEIRAILFLLHHAPSTVANCYRMRSLRWQFATVCAVCASNWHTVCAVCANNLLPYAHCAEYANKADHMLNLPIYLNQVLTNEKSEKSEKAILTPSSGPQRNLNQLFLVLTQSQKSLLAYTMHTLAKIKW